MSLARNVFSLRAGLLCPWLALPTCLLRTDAGTTLPATRGGRLCPLGKGRLTRVLGPPSPPLTWLVDGRPDARRGDNAGFGCRGGWTLAVAGVGGRGRRGGCRRAVGRGLGPGTEGQGYGKDSPRVLGPAAVAGGSEQGPGDGVGQRGLGGEEAISLERGKKPSPGKDMQKVTSILGERQPPGT